jgi:hypothetical protein
VSLFRRRDAAGQSAGEVIPPRPGTGGGAAAVTQETALRHSAVWACLRLRANLISTMPVDLYRKVDGIQVEVPKPAVLVTPGGDEVEMPEWMYSSQFDLDRSGNSVGLITARDGLNLPARIELVPSSDVSVRMRKGKKTYRIAGTSYEPNEVWHEKQYTVPGLPVGLSPVAYAAWAISEYLSIQQFAMDWFRNGAIPSAHLKNTAKTLSPEQADGAKTAFQGGRHEPGHLRHRQRLGLRHDPGRAGGRRLDRREEFGIGDIARFFDCPSDLIDASVSGSSVTYANMTQRNLQFLVMSLGPAVSPPGERAEPPVLPATVREAEPQRAAGDGPADAGLRHLDPHHLPDAGPVRGPSPVRPSALHRAAASRVRPALRQGHSADAHHRDPASRRSTLMTMAILRQQAAQARAGAAGSTSMTVPRDRPESPEIRFTSQLRAKKVQRDDGMDWYQVEGYASAFEQGYEMWDMFGPYTEVVSKGAADKTLAADPEVVFRFNHAGTPMASTRNARLELWADDQGSDNARG